jgi:hypothetical protein
MIQGQAYGGCVGIVNATFGGCVGILKPVRGGCVGIVNANSAITNSAIFILFCFVKFHLRVFIYRRAAPLDPYSWFRMFYRSLRMRLLPEFNDFAPN